MTNRLRSLLHPGSGRSSRVRSVIRMMFIRFSLGAVLSAGDDISYGKGYHTVQSSDIRTDFLSFPSSDNLVLSPPVKRAF
jgi:hypothetical protein